MYQRMSAAGQVRLGSGNLLDLLTPPPKEPGEKSLSETVRELRDEER